MLRSCSVTIDGRSRHSRQSGRLAAPFLFDLWAILMGPIEVALIAGHFHDPRPKATRGTNASGNPDPSASIGGADLRGLASTLIAEFTRWAVDHSVRLIGRLMTEFADAPTPNATLAAIGTVYLANGGEFLELPNRSRYPRHR